MRVEITTVRVVLALAVLLVLALMANYFFQWLMTTQYFAPPTCYDGPFTVEPNAPNCVWPK